MTTSNYFRHKALRAVKAFQAFLATCIYQRVACNTLINAGLRDDLIGVTTHIQPTFCPLSREVIDNYKGELLDECVEMGRIVALGIPKKDNKGNFIGWKERPDPSMIRYYLSTLGRKEGYGEQTEDIQQSTLQSVAPPQIIFEK